ncbi:hypothetical protein ABH922_005308 [Rhodococcus sp. 27YEA15]
MLRSRKFNRQVDEFITLGMMVRRFTPSLGAMC